MSRKIQEGKGVKLFYICVKMAFQFREGGGGAVWEELGWGEHAIGLKYHIFGTRQEQSKRGYLGRLTAWGTKGKNYQMEILEKGFVRKKPF